MQKKKKKIVYFSLSNYFFYFTISFFRTSHTRLSILYYNLLKCQFFFNYFSFLHITTTIYSLL